MRHCKPGELRRLATVSMPDTCARLKGSRIYRIADLIKTAKEWQKIRILKYASSSLPSEPSPGNAAGEMRTRGEKAHCGSTTPAGWSDEGQRNQTGLGSCRLGCVIELAPSTLRGPCHIIQWSPKSTRKLAKSSMGGKVNEFSEMLGRVALLRKLYAHFTGLSPGEAGLEDCESIFTHLKTKRAGTGEYLDRRFLGIRQSLGGREPDHV